MISMAQKNYRLVDADGRSFGSSVSGRLSGHRKTRIYGRLDCPNALRWLAKGHYAAHRVFFREEKAARGAGYRPCAICLPDEYARRRAGRCGKAS